MLSQIFFLCWCKFSWISYTEDILNPSNFIYIVHFERLFNAVKCSSENSSSLIVINQSKKKLTSKPFSLIFYQKLKFLNGEIFSNKFKRFMFLFCREDWWYLFFQKYHSMLVLINKLTWKMFSSIVPCLVKNTLNFLIVIFTVIWIISRVYL